MFKLNFEETQHIIFLLFSKLSSAVLGNELRFLDMPGKHSTTKLPLCLVPET